LRIVHVSDCYLPRLGGIERQVHDLAVRQRQRGHEVQIVTCVADGQPEPVDGVPVRRPRPRSGEYAGTIRYGWSVRGRRAVLDGVFDVVHVHASTMSPLAFSTAAATANRGIPTVLTAHSLWAYASPLFRCADLAVGWRRWPLTWSAVSAVAAGPLQRVLGPEVPVAILPNGAEAPPRRMPPVPRDPGRIVVANVGRLARRKRPRQLLRMLRRARLAIPAKIRLEAVIAGDGPLAPSLARYLEHHGMTDWVHLVGAADHDQIRAMHELADFYVAPATLESFGIAALEARCAGLPVIAHAGTGIAEFITDGVEGLLAADDNDMVDRIVDLARTPAKLARMRHHNASTPARITWDDVLQQSETLYEGALDSTPTRDRSLR
jgi:glycosyltransferase involved in cell wall biosynthesis